MVLLHVRLDLGQAEGSMFCCFIPDPDAPYIALINVRPTSTLASEHSALVGVASDGACYDSLETTIPTPAMSHSLHTTLFENNGKHVYWQPQGSRKQKRKPGMESILVHK